MHKVRNGFVGSVVREATLEEITLVRQYLPLKTLWLRKTNWTLLLIATGHLNTKKNAKQGLAVRKSQLPRSKRVGTILDRLSPSH